MSAAAAAALDAEGEALAHAVTGRLYAERPALLERHGARGREKCLQDMRYTLEHLRPAVELDSPPMFARYAAWCDEVLASRGVPTEDLARCLELMEEEVRARLPAGEAEAAARALRAGIAALAPAEEG